MTETDKRGTDETLHSTEDTMSRAYEVTCHLKSTISMTVIIDADSPDEAKALAKEILHPTDFSSGRADSVEYQIIVDEDVIGRLPSEGEAR